MKLESLVIVDQHATVNTFPGLVHTARHTMGVVSARSRRANRKEADVVGRGDDWGEVVTRYPYRKVGMDYLLMELILCQLSTSLTVPLYYGALGPFFFAFVYLFQGFSFKAT